MNETVTAQDQQYMAQALQLARRGAFTVHPNPMVGCVLVKDDVVIGQGWHRRAGEDHAEILALKDAQAKGHAVQGATAYVTLEPCAHRGRTGPCCEALAAAQISRVVAAMRDPNPQVAGRGLSYLQQQNIAISSGVLEAQARELNRAFCTWMEQGRPYVQLKVAARLDGATAMANGDSQWITGAAAREDVQRLRAQVGAIVTGSGTFYADDPALTVRPQHWQYQGYPASPLRQPLRVVVASQPPQAKAFSSQLFSDEWPVLWAAPGMNAASLPEASQVEGLPVQCAADTAQVDLGALLLQLAQRDIASVLVEAGAGLAGAFMARGLVDELIVYTAPLIMGSTTRRMFDWPLAQMAERQQWTIKSVRQVGETVRMVLRPQAAT